jgi:hypothetical protein
MSDAPLIINLAKLKNLSEEGGSVTGDLRLSCLDAFLQALNDSEDKDNKLANLINTIKQKTRLVDPSLVFTVSQVKKELRIVVEFKSL